MQDLQLALAEMDGNHWHSILPMSNDHQYFRSSAKCNSGISVAEGPAQPCPSLPGLQQGGTPVQSSLVLHKSLVCPHLEFTMQCCFPCVQTVTE